jgi:hypothetical protein
MDELKNDANLRVKRRFVDIAEEDSLAEKYARMDM